MFIGREQEGRAVILAAKARRSVVVVAPMGYGKSALLSELHPIFEAQGVALKISKVGPFSTFLDDLFLELRVQRVSVPGVSYSSDLKADMKAWKKEAGDGTAARARSLLEALRRYASTGTARAVIVIDDASELSASMVPWFIAFDEVAVLAVAAFPQTLAKKPLQRLWTRFDRVNLPPLPVGDSRTLLDALVTRYGIVAENMEAYKKRVLSLSSGVPAEIDRLVRFVAVEDIVKNRDVGTSFAQDAADRQERGIALAPMLLVLGGVAMITKYVGLARGEMDLYLVGGIGIAVMLVFGPFFRKVVLTHG